MALYLRAQHQPGMASAEREEGTNTAYCRRHLDACRMERWYPRLKKYSIETRFVQLPSDFVDYLDEDGLNVALDGPHPHSGCSDEGGMEEGETERRREGRVKTSTGSVEEEDGSDADTPRKDGKERERYYKKWDRYDVTEAVNDVDDDEEWDEDEEGEETNLDERFPTTTRAIREAISALDGVCFPKLCWSSPKDASWIAFGQTLRCTSAQDIVLLLKSSDYSTHNLCYAYASAVEEEERAGTQLSHSEVEGRGQERPKDVHLCLRRWKVMDARTEYRVFVRKGQVVGVCPRDLSSTSTLKREDMQEIRNHVTKFVSNIILPNFELDSFAVDIWLRPKQGHSPASPTSPPSLPSSPPSSVYADVRIRIIDISPYGWGSALLFEWGQPPLLPLTSSTSGVDGGKQRGEKEKREGERQAERKVGEKEKNEKGGQSPSSSSPPPPPPPSSASASASTETAAAEFRCIESDSDLQKIRFSMSTFNGLPADLLQIDAIKESMEECAQLPSARRAEKDAMMVDEMIRAMKDAGVEKM
uniref:Cell division cycle protein 123 n=1 Tax=Palpitomonas bilix TaxID=652834 RepID=A0A7S3GB65_9EUKA